MVKINIIQKKVVVLLVIFFLGFYIGYFWGIIKQGKENFQKEEKVKAKLKIERKNTLEIAKEPIFHTDKAIKAIKKESNKKSPVLIKKININTASTNELVKLPGIGEKIAKNIINYRHQNGPFRDTKELLKVKRIGPKILIKIQDMITVGNNLGNNQ